MQQSRKPERLRVMLVADGSDCYTQHRFIRTDIQPDPAYGMLLPQYAFIFRCDDTGTERQYGLEGAPSPHLQSDDEESAA